MYLLLFSDADELAGDLGERTATKTHQKGIIEDNASCKSTKFYNDQQNPNRYKVGTLYQLMVFQPLY